MNRLYRNGLLPVLGGLCALMVAMGIGRFAYTALLPGMMDTHGFGEDVAGVMAAWNYAGYLAGVLAMRKETPGVRRDALFVFFLLLSVATTAGMGLVQTNLLWHTMRFLAGFASGASFVLCSAIVLDTLIIINKPMLAGILYSGVGAGIALGGIAAKPFEAMGGPATAWLGMAALCLPLAIISFTTMTSCPAINRAPVPKLSMASATVWQNGKPRNKYGILLIVYFLEGFGYIIGATFLVTLVQTVTHSPDIARISWIVTGCAAALSAPLWRIAVRKSYLPALVLAFLVQGIGILLPVISNSIFAALSAGLLLGGTFMGITTLSLQYGITLSGKPSAHTVAVMTALYGVGQIIGPLIAGITAQGQGFSLAFILSAISLFIAAGLLIISNIKKSSRIMIQPPSDDAIVKR
ncbi:MAG: YbfB/YjiJ family MFS transporter [Burkholderiales bacterium]|jgi:predicted MFS family arabinose efflux permease|nr:YbfB/YjiJ family MFS transporter [Burkholderiales bacterium]